MSLRNECGRAILATIVDLGLTNAELAKRTGFTEKHVCKALQGKGASMEAYDEMAAALGIRLVVARVNRGRQS